MCQGKHEWGEPVDASVFELEGKLGAGWPVLDSRRIILGSYQIEVLLIDEDGKLVFEAHNFGPVPNNS